MKDIDSPLIKKIDVYMRHHVEPWFDIESVRWWFSLSGGKDSFAMALGVKEWYEERGKKLDARCFHITQWSLSAPKYISRQLPWIQFINVDGRLVTQERIEYKLGDQAPCRKCADVRRELNDKLISNYDDSSGRINFIARGLHLTDTTVSLLWRRSLGYEPVQSLINSGKGKPLTRLWENVFLVKPLFYAREFETEIYTRSKRINTCCCGCPACKFPSRRDIVEETIVPLFSDPLWEFSTPDLNEFFLSLNRGPTLQEVKSVSIPGKESKSARLPDKFPSFAVDYYLKRLKFCDLEKVKEHLDFNHNLDILGMTRLLERFPLRDVERIPAPALLRNDFGITEKQALLISSLGPFWGALALSKQIRTKALALQEALFGLKIQEDWAHSHELLKKYYGKMRDGGHNRADAGFPSISCSCSCACSP